MDKITRREQQISYAKMVFSHHKAVFRQLDGISTLDWRKEDGSSDYYVRYVFDESRGFLYISGDLGSAVVRLTERATLQALSGYINKVDYFVEKIECSTDKYYYDEEIEERQDCLEELMEQFTGFDGFRTVSDDSHCLLSEICPDYGELLCKAGRYMATRIILWLVGLQMAWEQVKKEVAAND